MLYKLTNQKYETYGPTVWGEGVRHEAAAGAPELCTSTVIHAYRSAEEAALFNVCHVHIAVPVLWECPDEEIVVADALKVGVKALTTSRIIPLPVFTLDQLVRFAIYCVPQTFENVEWRTWANAWLSGKDRTVSSANRVQEARGVELWRLATIAAMAAAAAAWAAETQLATAEAAELGPLDFLSLIRQAVADESELSAKLA